MKIAMITGVRGQDGSYLSELLLSKGYYVIGIDRRISNPDYSNLANVLNHKNFKLENGDITDSASMTSLVHKYCPNEFYNLAAQSFVAASWTQPLETNRVNYDGVGICLEAIKQFAPRCRFYQASTSEVYGDVLSNSQNEKTEARPRSPYAAAKYGAEGQIKVYRDSYDMFACFGRLFNHESPRRGKEFVTRKITDWIGRSWNTVDRNIKEIIGGEGKIDTQTAFEKAVEKGIISPLELGNLDAQRDWSHAKDMVRGMWLMLQQDEPRDFVLASGATRSIRDFLDDAFAEIGISNWENLVVINPKFFRPAEVRLLCGDYSRAKKALGWEPEISFKELVAEMVNNDIKLNDV